MRSSALMARSCHRRVNIVGPSRCRATAFSASAADSVDITAGSSAAPSEAAPIREISVSSSDMDADARSHSLAAAAAAWVAPPSVSASRTNSSPSTSSNGAISSAFTSAAAGTCAHSATSAAHSVSGVLGAARAVAESARAPDGDANDAYAEGASAAAFSRRRAMASWSAVRRFASRLRACHHLARLAGVASAASMVASMDGW